MARRLLFALLLVVSALPLLSAQSADLVIRNVRVFDGEAVRERQTVFISGGKIAAMGDSAMAVPGGAQEVAGDGRTLLPGLIDAHVHLPLFGPDQALQQTLAFGVTTAVVMWGAPPLVSQVKALETTGRTDTASVLIAGLGATAPGGHPTQMDGGAGAKTPTIASPADADAFVAARIAEGSEFLKIVFDDTSEAFPQKLPTLTEQTVAALAAAAHKRDRLAVAHIGTEQYARRAIAAGVDGLAHLFVGPVVSANFGQFAAKRGVFVIPTLSVLYAACGRSDGPRLLQDAETMTLIKDRFRYSLEWPPAKPGVSCDAAPQAVRQLAAAGVPVLAGTDSPGAGTTYGVSLHWELEHLVNAGLTPTAALASATSATARAFRMNDRGRIRPGMRADLLLVGGDPTKQIRDTRNIVAIWKQGVRVQPR
jgi:imidazolonepropionase-like amidohydrolase